MMTPKKLVAELQRLGLDVDEGNLTEWREKRLLPELKILGRRRTCARKRLFLDRTQYCSARRIGQKAARC